MTNFLDDQNASSDKLAKHFLSRKSILAQILKYTIEEFADCAVFDIEKKYIEGELSLSINTVPLDDTLHIIGKNTESTSLNESFVTFDIIFDAIAPHDELKNYDLFKIIILNLSMKKLRTNFSSKNQRKQFYQYD